MLFLERRTAVVCWFRAVRVTLSCGAVLFGASHSRQSEPWEATTTHILIVGVDEMQHSIDNNLDELPEPRADAEAVADYFRAMPGVKLYGPLTGDRATLEGIRRVVRYAIAPGLKEGDRVIFYYSGHGIKANGGALVPYNGQLNDPATLLSRKEIIGWGSGLLANARHVLFLVDACFFGATVLGPLDDDVKLTLPGSLTPEEARTFYASRKTRYVIAASGNTEPALANGPDKKLSLFTYHLLEGLRGASDADGDGFVDQVDLGTWVRHNAATRVRVRGQAFAIGPATNAFEGDESGAFIFRTSRGSLSPQELAQPQQPDRPAKILGAEPGLSEGLQQLHPRLVLSYQLMAFNHARVPYDGRALFVAGCASSHQIERVVYHDFTLDSTQFEPPVIASVDSGSDAWNQGLRAGDVLLTWGDDTLRNTIDFVRHLGIQSVGHVGLIRQGTQATVELTAPSRPDTVMYDSASALSWRYRVSGWQMTWRQAAQYIRLLNARQFGGRSDWRLPTVREALYGIARIHRSGGAVRDRCSRSPATDPLSSPMAGSVDDVWTNGVFEAYRWVVHLAAGEPGVVAGEDPTVRKAVWVVAGKELTEPPRN